MFAAGQANMGVLNCYEPNAFPVNPRGYTQPGYRGEQYLVGAGNVTLSRWTPNRLSFDIEAPSPTMLVVNQNYDPGWRLVEGQGIAISSEGLIAVMMPAGRQHIELAYRSRPFMIGLWISLLTVAAIPLLWRYEHRCGKRLAGISGWIARIIMLPRRRYRTLEEEGR